MVHAGPLSERGELAGATMLARMNQAPASTAVAKMQSLKDAFEHERTARKHEAEVHNLTKEYSMLQRKKSITDADYGVEKHLLASEYAGHMERRLRAAAYDAELNRVQSDPVYDSEVQRQMFCRDLHRFPVTSRELLNTVPDGGYVAPVFTKDPAVSSLTAMKNPKHGHLKRAANRVSNESAAQIYGDHLSAYTRDKVSEESRLYGRPLRPLWG